MLNAYKYRMVDGDVDFCLSENSIDAIEKVLANTEPNSGNLTNIEPTNFVESFNIVLTIPPIIQCSVQSQTIRKSLPIFKYRNDILNAIGEHQVVVISGETGLLMPIILLPLNRSYKKG